ERAADDRVSPKARSIDAQGKSLHIDILVSDVTGHAVAGKPGAGKWVVYIAEQSDVVEYDIARVWRENIDGERVIDLEPLDDGRDPRVGDVHQIEPRLEPISVGERDVVRELLQRDIAVRDHHGRIGGCPGRP